MYLSSPLGDHLLELGDGRRVVRPLKPPIVTTALPVWMMIGAVVCEPVAATRYFALPWWASR